MALNHLGLMRVQVISLRAGTGVDFLKRNNNTNYNKKKENVANLHSFVLL